MKRLVWSLCLVIGCVLPEYQVDNSKPITPVAPNMTEPTLPLSDAPEACNTCLSARCAPQREACGGDCDALSWPMSPAWSLSDRGDPFASCLVKSCSEQCQALWGCVENYELPAPPDPYDVTLRLSGVLDGSPVANVKVNACQALDPSCSSGGGEENTVTSDANGRATITVANDFFGYFIVDAGEGFYPMTVLWSQPTYRADHSFEVSLFPRLWIGGLSALVDAPLQEDAGNIIFRAENCLPLRYLANAQDSDAAADNVVVTYDTTGPDTTRTFYTTYGFMLDPDATATRTVGGGFGGALNVPVGLRSVTGTHEDDEVSRATLRLRAGTVGLVFLAPNTR